MHQALHALPQAPGLQGLRRVPTVLENKLSSHRWTCSPTGLPEGKAGPEARVNTRLSPSASGGREGTALRGDLVMHSSLHQTSPYCGRILVFLFFQERDRTAVT